MKIKEDKISRILHWGFACFVIMMLGIGIYMKNTEYSLVLFQWHKSLGVIFSALIGIRIYWSIRHPWKSPFVGNKYETLARSSAHTLLLVSLIAMPVTGLLSSGYSGYSVHLFDLIIIPENINQAGEVEPFNATFYKIAKISHKVLAYSFTALILLHIAAVLKHHFINKDRTLLKMLNGK